MTITLQPIGIIHSPFKSKESFPIQGLYSSDAKGEVELFNEYSDGLKDIETFSHIILIYHFSKAGEIELVRPTFLDDEAHGVFASRHPCRPNGLGITIVNLIKCKGNILEVSAIDVIDGTPLIDIKPYIPRFDCFPDATEGWVESKKWRPKPKGRE
ncbi:tRNA (N6-threonylcarbamoyladenosine(37)-N6)-methyltransferase TrmO [Thermodesulfobacteriota bacterium]